MRYRLRIEVTCDHVGRRVTVRFRDDPSGFSDVVGILEACDDERFTIRDRHGAVRIVARERVVAAKIVTAPAIRPEG